MSFYDTLTKSPVVREVYVRPMPAPAPYAIGCLLVVTDCFGKEFPCQFVGMAGKQALIQINGHKMATDIKNLKKRFK